jgi:FMN phosphatase YigB (HAD superfamily)
MTQSSEPSNTVFLFDVDNTLLDNDAVQADLRDHLAENYGPAARDRYWAILEELRGELGYVDYLGALERYRVETLHRPELLRMSSWLVDYPFAGRLYPGALSMEGRKAISDEAIAILSRPKQALDKMGEEHSALRNSDYLAIAEINNSAFLPTASASG